jgi:hypothetical protein
LKLGTSDQQDIQDTLATRLRVTRIVNSGKFSSWDKRKIFNQAIAKHLVGLAMYRPFAACRNGVTVSQLNAVSRMLVSYDSCLLMESRL